LNNKTVIDQPENAEDFQENKKNEKNNYDVARIMDTIHSVH